jgi:hypothetical protein
MSIEFEQAHEHLEHATHGEIDETQESHPKGTAILIAVMAAGLALIELPQKTRRPAISAITLQRATPGHNTRRSRSVRRFSSPIL